MFVFIFAERKEEMKNEKDRFERMAGELFEKMDFTEVKQQGHLFYKSSLEYFLSPGVHFFNMELCEKFIETKLWRITRPRLAIQKTLNNWVLFGVEY